MWPGGLERRFIFLWVKLVTVAGRKSPEYVVRHLKVDMEMRNDISTFYTALVTTGVRVCVCEIPRILSQK